MEKNLYEKIANTIEQQVREGIYLPDTKIPSVRKTSKQFDVSVATVLQAYRLLEDRGIIKARPQKGYFVHSLPKRSQSLPTQTTMTGAPHTSKVTSIMTLLNQVLHASQKSDVTQFAAAIPKGLYLPIRQLQRSVGRLMRLEPEICATYAFTPGSEVLRRQIAIRMLDAGCQTAMEDITVTLGCQNALLLALQATTQRGDKVIIESPAYHGVLQAIDVLGLQAIEIPCHRETGIDLSSFEQELQKTKVSACIVTPNNQNPTGATMPPGARKRLLALAQRYDLVVIEDDVYGELGYAEQREHALKADDKDQRVIYCSSFSKSIAPGFRVGWLVGGAWQDKIEALAHAQSLASPTLTQTAIANFLENGAYDRHLRKTRQAYQENLARCVALIQQYFPEQTKCSQPQGGFLLWVELPESIDALAIYQQAAQQNIVIMPGQAFGLHDRYHNYLRINYALPWDNSTDNAIRVLGELCQANLHLTS